nr:unnamed protein product [Digitaria exilis]
MARREGGRAMNGAQPQRRHEIPLSSSPVLSASFKHTPRGRSQAIVMAGARPVKDCVSDRMIISIPGRGHEALTSAAGGTAGPEEPCTCTCAAAEELVLFQAAALPAVELPRRFPAALRLQQVRRARKGAAPLHGGGRGRWAAGSAWQHDRARQAALSANSSAAGADERRSPRTAARQGLAGGTLAQQRCGVRQKGGGDGSAGGVTGEEAGHQLVQSLRAYTVEQAVEGIIPWLEGTGRTAYKAIYFDGWDGLAASSVLRSIAEDPPPSVKKKFDKILRIDCSRWKSPRALQRAIAHELKLPQSIMAAFDREDEDDDFSGVEEDIRFFQSLVEESVDEFAWGTTGPLKLNIYLPCTSMEDDGKNSKKDRLGRTAGHLVGEPSVAPTRTSQTSCPYNDVRIEEIAAFDTRRTSGLQFVPHNIHVEIRQGTINNTNVVAAQVIRAVQFVMNRVQSLHVHNNSSITSIIPDEISRPVSGKDINYRALKWCRLESCPKLDTVFYTNYGGSDLWFDKLENFWAADLLMARSIWSRGRPYHARDAQSFAKLHAIHLYSCRRLQFVLPLSWGHTLSSLETLHIVCCGDLKQVFPVEERFLSAIATEHPNGMLEFPKLKHLYLQDLFCLQQICEAKIFAPVLETVHLRGCWALRRLPATSRYRQDGRLVAVDCERDWWEKLEWDGLRVGHHHSLFAPRHSAYYKKRQLRTTVLR